MNDITIPSYRVRPVEAGSSWRLLAIAGGVVGVMALGGAAWWGVSRLGGPHAIPVIEPDPRPVKVRPDNPGGLRVANQDELIFDRNARERARPTGTARLAPEPERPALDQLRAQVAPPPAVMMPEPAPPPPAAAAGTAQPEPGGAVAAATPPPAAAAPPAAETAAAAPPGAGQQASAAARPAAAPPAAAPAPGGRVQIQLGALISEEAARTEWERLSRRMPELLGAFRPHYSRFDRGEGVPPMWRVRTGGFADAPTARAFCEQARARGAACAVVGG